MARYFLSSVFFLSLTFSWLLSPALALAQDLFLEGSLVADEAAPPGDVGPLLVSLSPGDLSLELQGGERFRFEGLSAMSYTLTVSGEGIATEVVQVDLSQGSLEGLLVTLRAAFTLTGVVTVAGEGLALEGALVEAVEAQAQASSDPQGAWSLVELPPGAHTLRISAQGFATVERVVLVDQPGVVLESALVPVGGAWTLEVTVQDPQGSPLPGAQVVVGGGAALALDPVDTDADGVARLEGLPSGSYRVEALAQGWQSQVASSVLVRQDTALTLMLVPLEAAAEAGQEGCAAAPGRRGQGGWPLGWWLRRSTRPGAGASGIDQRSRRW